MYVHTIRVCRVIYLIGTCTCPAFGRLRELAGVGGGGETDDPIIEELAIPSC